MNELWQKIKNHSILAKNTGYLSIIELFRLALPFIALPYIIRTVGAENYGIAIFAQTIISYFSIVISFGLDISAVKDVSVNRDNPAELNKIVSAVLSIKLILFLLSFGVILAGLLFVPFFEDNKALMLFAFLTCLSDFLLPVWFYQGIEKMKYLTLVKSLSIVFYTVTVFIFVKQADDYPIFVLLQSLGNVVAAFVAIWLLVKVNKVKFVRVPWAYMWLKFKESVPFFLSRLSDTFNSAMAKTVSGVFFSMEAVAAFDLAQKIAKVAQIPMQMLNQAAYPHVAKSRDVRFVRKFFTLNVGLSAVVALMVYLLAPIAIHIFAGDQMPEAITLTRILSVWVFVAGITIFIGAPVLVAFGYPKPFNNSVILSSVCLALIYFGMYATNILSIYMFAVALFLSEVVILVYRLYYCNKYGLISLRRIKG